MQTDFPGRDMAGLDELLSARPAEPRYILAILQDIQARFRYLPEEALKAVAAYLNLPQARVFAVASFYSALSLTPKGEKAVKVCCGTACHLRGAPGLIEALEKELGLELGQTRADGAFSLESVNCLGACALAPVVTVESAEGEETFGELSPATVSRCLGRD